uniref:Uncharacterized protein n=1 Tax=Anguilla anguilla TaxID=7936 RepID=A0A0E9QZB1_ANGAN
MVSSHGRVGNSRPVNEAYRGLSHPPFISRSGKSRGP